MQIYLHGNNLSTLHQHLPLDILPSELGGTGPGFNPGLWAEPVIHSAIKEAEVAMQNGQQNEQRIEHSSESSRKGSVVTVVEMHANGNDETSKREAGDGSESKITTNVSYFNSIEMKNMASPDDVNLDHPNDMDSPAEKLGNSSEFEIVQREADESMHESHNTQIEEKRNLIS